METTNITMDWELASIGLSHIAIKVLISAIIICCHSLFIGLFAIELFAIELIAIGIFAIGIFAIGYFTIKLFAPFAIGPFTNIDIKEITCIETVEESNNEILGGGC